jgi:competence protein ComEA
MRVLVLMVSFIGFMCVSLAAQQAGAPAAKAASPGKSVSASAPVNLNTATQAQLEALPGIGPSAAQRILEYRQKNGSFKKIEDLMQVKGIGEKSFLKLKPLITVGPEKGSRTDGGL